MGFLLTLQTPEKPDAPKLAAKALEVYQPTWKTWVYLPNTTEAGLNLEEAKELLSQSDASACVVGGLVSEAEGTPPIRIGKYWLAGLGRPSKLKNWRQLASQLVQEASKPPTDFLASAGRKLQGNYLLALMVGEACWALRDPIGCEPLFYRETPSVSGFSTCRKALWKLGLKGLQRLKPGWLCQLQAGKLRVFQALPTPEPCNHLVSFEEAVERLVGKLLEAFRLRVEGLDGHVGVLFSGGLDSSLTAHLLASLGLKVVLYVAGLEASRDLEAAEKAAEALNLNLKVGIIGLEGFEEKIKQAIYASERFTPTDIGIALPLHAAASLASREGVKILFAGQGFDELFGGYARYTNLLAKEGWGSLEEAMKADMLNLAEANLERDVLTALHAGVRLELPAAEPSLVGFALAVPTNFKVSGPCDGLRKRVLRAAAERLGLPARLAWKPKKAVQYGSGTIKALKAEAGKHGLKVGEYLARLFEEVFKLRPHEA